MFDDNDVEDDENSKKSTKLEYDQEIYSQKGKSIYQVEIIVCKYFYVFYNFRNFKY